MVMKHNFDAIKKDDKIRSIVYSSSGAHFYRCGSIGIYKTDTNTYLDEPFKFPDGLKGFVKVRISSSEDVLVVSDDNQGLYMNKKDPASNSLTAEQVLVIAIPGFGLAPNGVNVFSVQNKDLNIAQVVSQCKSNEFLNENTLTCVTCSASDCTICSSTVCYMCKPSFYLSSSNTCLACNPYCATCNNGENCQTCL